MSCHNLAVPAASVHRSARQRVASGAPGSKMALVASNLGVLLGDGAGGRILGLSVKARNHRVALRAGARVANPGTEVTPLLYVPPTVVIEPSVFAHLPAPTGEVSRVVPAGGGPAMLWGPGPAVESALKGELEPQGELEMPPETAHDVSTRRARFRAERSLLRRSGKRTDGVVSRTLNRPVSRVFSYLFLRAGLTAWHASVASLGIGLVCAYFTTQTSYLSMVIAGLLFQAASIFDGVDGEMARLTLRESKLGAKIDTMFDHMTYLACLAGFTIGWMAEGVGPVGVGLAVFAVVGVPLTLLHVLSFIRRYAPDASFVFLDTCVHRAARENDSPTLRLASSMFNLFRRDVFSAAFMLLTLSGSRELIVGLLVGGLVVSNLTLLLHRDRLVEAAASLHPAGARSALGPEPQSASGAASS